MSRKRFKKEKDSIVIDNSICKKKLSKKFIFKMKKVKKEKIDLPKSILKLTRYYVCIVSKYLK